MSSSQAAALFVILWIITFIPAWYLLGKLLIYAASPKRSFLTIKFLALLIIYELVVALPYIPILVTDNSLPGFVKGLAFGILLISLLLIFVRLFIADKAQSVLWNVYGYVYDGLLSFYPYVNLLKLCIGKLDVTNSDRVLDLGCGTANASKLISLESPEQLTCVDGSKSMLKNARKKIKDKKAEIILSDALAYLNSCRDNTFDKVLMINVLYAIEDRKLLWKELHRITKKNAKVVVTSSDRGGSISIIKEHLHNDSWLKLFRPRLLGVFIVDALISGFAKNNVFHFISEQQMVAEINAANWKVVSTVRCYGGSQNGVNILLELKKT